MKKRMVLQLLEMPYSIAVVWFVGWLIEIVRSVESCSIHCILLLLYPEWSGGGGCGDV